MATTLGAQRLGRFTTMDEQLRGGAPSTTDYLRPLWRRKYLILAVAILATAATYAYYDAQDRVYAASSQILVGESLLEQALYDQSASGPPSERLVVNQARLLVSRPVAARVAGRLGSNEEPAELLRRVSATPVQGTDFVVIDAEGPSPDAAEDLADAFADAFIALREEAVRAKVRAALLAARRELAGSRTDGGRTLDRRALKAQVERLEAIQRLPAGNAEIVERAAAKPSAVFPRPTRSAVFALALALLVGAGLALGMNRIDRRVRRLEDIERGYDPLPLLSIAPHQRRRSRARKGSMGSDADLREAMRTLCTNLRLAGIDGSLRTVMVTSALPGEGKSTIARNLAVAYAEMGNRVVLVECDLRRPTLAQSTGAKSLPGLVDVLAGNAELSVATQQLELESDRAASEDGAGAPSRTVHLLTGGSSAPNPTVLLGSSSIRRILMTLAGRYDTVLLDTPPLLPVSDTLPLLGVVDAVVLVARVNHTRTDAMRRVTQLLVRHSAPAVGVVANDVPEAEIAGGYRDYGYGGGRQRSKAVA